MERIEITATAENAAEFRAEANRLRGEVRDLTIAVDELDMVAREIEFKISRGLEGVQITIEADLNKRRPSRGPQRVICGDYLERCCTERPVLAPQPW